MTDYAELLKRFAEGTVPLSAQEMEQLCRWAEGQQATTDDIRLLQQISRTRKYHAGLARFKSDYRRHERRAARWLWPATAAAAVLAAVLLVRPADSPQLAQTDLGAVKQMPQQEAPAAVAQSNLPVDLHETPSAADSMPHSIIPQEKVCESAHPAPATEIVAEEPERPTVPYHPTELLLAEAEHEEADSSATGKPQRIVIESRSIVAYENRPRQSTWQNRGEELKDILGNPIDPNHGVLFAMAL